jgi:hypothetical protein
VQLDYYARPLDSGNLNIALHFEVPKCLWKEGPQYMYTYVHIQYILQLPFNDQAIVATVDSWSYELVQLVHKFEVTHEPACIDPYRQFRNRIQCTSRQCMVYNVCSCVNREFETHVGVWMECLREKSMLYSLSSYHSSTQSIPHYWLTNMIHSWICCTLHNVHIVLLHMGVSVICSTCDTYRYAVWNYIAVLTCLLSCIAMYSKVCLNRQPVHKDHLSIETTQLQWH